VWLPEDAPLSATNEAARRAEEVVRGVAEEYGREHSKKDGKPREVLESLTAFVGGGGPRFWFSVSPEMQQLNYAQVIIQVKDKHDTNHLIGPMQKALDTGAGRAHDVRQLDTGKPITMPVEIRISGDDDRVAPRGGEGEGDGAPLPTHNASATTGERRTSRSGFNQP
jgi:hypothetical protein